MSGKLSRELSAESGPLGLLGGTADFAGNCPLNLPGPPRRHRLSRQVSTESAGSAGSEGWQRSGRLARKLSALFPLGLLGGGRADFPWNCQLSLLGSLGLLGLSWPLGVTVLKQ